MNSLARNVKFQFKSFTSTSLNSLIKGKNFGNEIYLKQFIPFENKCFIHTSAAFYAGHSKWQNIKQTKGSKDAQKGEIINKLSVQIKSACRLGGNTDPKINSQLAKVLERAKQSNMPVATIDRVLKSMEQANANGKPGILNLFKPGGFVMCVDVFTDNINRTRTEIRGLVKKLGFKDHPYANLDSIFESKGYIITKPGDLNKAMEDAIEAGAEDVTEEEDNTLKFVCDPDDFLKVRNIIEKMKYEIEYASVDKTPYSMLELSLPEADMVKMQAALTKLEEHHEVVRMQFNFEL